MSGNMPAVGVYTVTYEDTTGAATATHATKTSLVSQTQEVVEHILTDNRTGSFGDFGTINYAGKTLNVRFVRLDKKSESYQSDYQNAESMEQNITGDLTNSNSTSSSSKGGEYGTTDVSEEILGSSSVSVTYATSFASPQSYTASVTPNLVTIDLCPYTTDYIVPGSVRFTWMGHVYEDYEGVIYRDRAGNDPGTPSGQLDYSSGIATMFDYVVSGSANSFSLDSLWTQRLLWKTSSVFGRTQSSPVAPSGFAMQVTAIDGTQYTASGGVDGLVTGAGVRGKIDYRTGLFELNFGDFVLDTALTAAEKAEWWYNAADVGAVEAGKIWRPRVVDPRLLRYNAVTYFYLPIDASILGVDPVRLPQDGRVPIFRTGGFAVVGNTKTTAPATVTNGQTVNTARTRLSRVRVIGSDNATINTGYTANLEAGTVTFTDVTGYAQPVRIEHRIEDMVVLADVQIDGTMQFTRQLTHNYPAGESYISSAMVAGDIRARTQLTFDQVSWTGVWQDTPPGAGALGQYNTIDYPIEVTNAGAMTERWALIFTNSTSFTIQGEHLGTIGVGNINSDTAPVNPISGQPYFRIREGGWGSGWSTGNVLRFNTIGAFIPVWVARTVQPGPEAGGDYTFELLVRGDVDAPAP